MMNQTFFPRAICNATPLQAPSPTSVFTSQSFPMPRNHKVVTKFPTNLKMGDVVLEVLDEGNAWTVDGYTTPTVDYVNCMVDWEQLKPDVADSLVVDLIDSLEQDLAAEPKKEICPAIRNEQIFCQAWYPFFQCPAAVQMLPFQKRVFLGPCVSVPRQFMAVPQMTLPKSPVNTRKRKRCEKDICSATYSHRRCKA